MKDKSDLRQQIERRAHEIYAQRGCSAGNELADWIAAENELLSGYQGGPTESLPETYKSCSSTRMILDFHGLREQPFGMTPDPAYLYASRTHTEALASLSFGIRENRGFFALIAEPGMGKTTLLYQLLEDLRDSARTVFLFHTQCDSREFLRYILQDLSIDSEGMDLVSMHHQLNQRLFAEMMDGKHFVLIVDEAQNLDEPVLETVRMLSNFETHNTKLVQIVLAGQPALALKLAHPRLLQLRQRIAVLSHLEPFSATETALYVEHRLKIAGYVGEQLFETNAISLIAERSRGIPRNINNICYQSLLIARDRGTHTITFDNVQAAVTRLDVGFHAPQRLATDDPVASPIGLHNVDSDPETELGTKAGFQQTSPILTYKQRWRLNVPRWPLRAAALAAILLLGSLLPAMLERGGPTQANVAAVGSHDDGLWQTPTHPSNVRPMATDSAEPQQGGTRQVLTVIVRPQQSLKDLCLLYAGYFDADLLNEIRILNPELKDHNNLEAGQLIRIPLPLGTLRKVN